MNRVELRPVVQRSDSKHGFIGAIYVKEIRVVNDCECQGVSISTVASGANKGAVAAQIVAEATRRAQHYSDRGYKVITTKVQAA